VSTPGRFFRLNPTHSNPQGKNDQSKRKKKGAHASPRAVLRVPAQDVPKNLAEE